MPETSVHKGGHVAEPNSGVEKIASVRAGGEKAYKEGTVKVFIGFPENLKNRFNVSVFGKFPNDSILWRILKLSRKCGVVSILADLDFPLHCTVLEGLWEGSEEDRISLFERMSDEVGTLLNYSSPFISLTFTDLVLDGGGNLLLMSDVIPERVLQLRSNLANLYNANGLKVLPLDNMLHSTLQRVKEFSDPMKYFGSGVLWLHPINPFVGGIDFLTLNYYVGPALDLLLRQP